MISKKLPSALAAYEGCIFFLGIGGSGMYGVARLSAALGLRILGSDGKESSNVLALRACGIPVVSEGEALPENVSLVVYSFAVPETHPRREEAKARQIPCLDRASFFGILMQAFPIRVSVAGTHGKSSTTAMCAAILQAAGKDPTVVSGAPLGIGKDSFREGKGDILLFEACEYRDAFLSFCPTHALALSASWEHTDYFESKEAVLASFCAYLGGKSVLKSVAPAGLFSADVTYGKDGDLRAEQRVATGEGSSFLLVQKGRSIGRVTLRALGEHQIENALGAAALTLAMGIPEKAVIEGLSSYTGIPRRMEKKGVLRASPLYLDFAHHPKELFCALRTASQLGAPLAVVFEPHTYSRTKAFFEDYVRALRLPHMAGILPIYAAREKEDPLVSSLALAKAAGIAYLADYLHAARFLTRAAGKGCTLLLVGAGGVEEVLSYLPFLLPEGESAR